MTPKRWLALAAILTAMVLVQKYGLDRQPETKQEDKYRSVAAIPAKDMVPMYVASLFFGAFRAIVVDALWIQLKKVEDEKRWYEARQMIELVKYFQPRNPEVWSHLGHDQAYNIANGFTNPDRQWDWIRFGLKWLREGNDVLPDSPYLKYELARTLYHKPSWQESILLLPLLKRLEEDDELQKILWLGPPDSRRRSAFELAIPWLERARDELMARPEKYVITQAGLYVRPMSMDGFIRQCMYYQGIYDWQLHRWESAKDWFRRASGHTATMVARAKEYDDYMSSIFQDWVKFYARLPEVVELDRKAQESGRADDETALLAAMQALIVEFGPIDEMFLTSQNKRGRLDQLKRKASHGLDPLECNDSFELASALREGDPQRANFEPKGLDVDFYSIVIPNPAKQPKPEDRPPAPVGLTLSLSRPPGASLELKVTLFDGSRRPLQTVEVRKDLKVKQACDRYGTYYVKVEPLKIVDPWPADTSYTIRYELSAPK